MYKLSHVEISGFWQKYGVKSDFDQEVNVVIGKNGTGKTTFMNILHAVLSVDVDALFENDFTKAVLTLVDGRRNKKITVEKIENDDAPFPWAVYKISTKKFIIPIYGHDEHRTLPMSVRRRAMEEAAKIKNELSNLVALASLSVYRIGSDIDPEMRDRNNKRTLAPVDQRLSSLMQRLTHYQLELSTEARVVSIKLQREVLASLLYQKGSTDEPLYNSGFDESKERKNLIDAYKQLGISGSDITKRIQEHTMAIDESTKNLNAYLKEPTSSPGGFDLAPLEAYKRTAKVIKLSLDAAKKIDDIYQQQKIFLEILHGFIPDKRFSFDSGDLRLEMEGDVTIQRLSSGEKQLLILFIEALLQKRQPYIFLADEPELSLHISWQRNILPAIRKVNPNAQIIVATHSPEVASRFPSKIIDMEDIRHV